MLRPFLPSDKYTQPVAQQVAGFDLLCLWHRLELHRQPLICRSPKAGALWFIHD